VLKVTVDFSIFNAPVPTSRVAPYIVSATGCIIAVKAVSPAEILVIVPRYSSDPISIPIDIPPSYPAVAPLES
jgi:hypothetical protein